MTRKQLTEKDSREWKLSAISPHDKYTWRSGVRSAMHAASQLPARVVKIVNRYENVLLKKQNIYSRHIKY